MIMVADEVAMESLVAATLEIRTDKASCKRLLVEALETTELEAQIVRTGKSMIIAGIASVATLA